MYVCIYIYIYIYIYMCVCVCVCVYSAADAAQDFSEALSRETGTYDFTGNTFKSPLYGATR
jgi:hypothetical protein